MKLTKDLVLSAVKLGAQFFIPFTVRDLADVLDVPLKVALECLTANRSAFVIEGHEIKGVADESTKNVTLNSNELLAWFMEHHKTTVEKVGTVWTPAEIGGQLGNTFLFEKSVPFMAFPFLSVVEDGSDVRTSVTATHGAGIAAALVRIGTKKAQRTTTEQIGPDQYLFAVPYDLSTEKIIAAAGFFSFRAEWALKAKNDATPWTEVEYQDIHAIDMTATIVDMTPVVEAIGKLEATLVAQPKATISGVTITPNVPAAPPAPVALTAPATVAPFAVPAAPVPVEGNPAWTVATTGKEPEVKTTATNAETEAKRTVNRRTLVELNALRTGWAAEMGAHPDAAKVLDFDGVKFKEAEALYEATKPAAPAPAPKTTASIKQQIVDRAAAEGSITAPPAATPAPVPAAVSPMVAALPGAIPVAPLAAPAAVPAAATSASASALLSSLLKTASSKPG